MRSTLLMLSPCLALGLLACGDSSSGTDTDATTNATTDPTTTDPTTTTSETETSDGTTMGSTDPSTTDPSTTDPSTTDPSTTDPSTTGTTGMSELSCEHYCMIYLDSCADFSEYANEPDCLSNCMQWPEGTLEDINGDSLGCRIYHVSVASNTDPDVHCFHAGPSGGAVVGDPVCVNPGAPACDAYCMTFFGMCMADLNPYVDEADCLDQCAEWYQGTVDDVEGHTVGCRTYHAQAAQGDPDLHCPHAGPGGGGVCVLP